MSVLHCTAIDDVERARTTSIAVNVVLYSKRTAQRGFQSLRRSGGTGSGTCSGLPRTTERRRRGGPAVESGRVGSVRAWAQWKFVIKAGLRIKFKDVSLSLKQKSLMVLQLSFLSFRCEVRERIVGRRKQRLRMRMQCGADYRAAQRSVCRSAYHNALAQIRAHHRLQRHLRPSTSPGCGLALCRCGWL